MKKFIGIAAIILVVVAMSTPAFAFGPGRGMGNRMMGWGNPAYGGFNNNLTTEQRNQLDAIYKKYYDETAQIRNNLISKTTELRTALNSDNPDKEKAKSIQKEISDLQADLAQKRIDLQVEERKITPDLANGPGFGNGYRMMGRGYGPGRGPMERGFGPGACWN